MSYIWLKRTTSSLKDTARMGMWHSFI